MTDFTTRVVLYGEPTWAHYTRLAAAMAAEGFTDLIVGSDRVRYKMPPAEYTISSPLSLSQIHAKAKSAAASVWNDNAVFVTQSAGEWFSGLRIA